MKDESNSIGSEDGRYPRRSRRTRRPCVCGLYGSIGSLCRVWACPSGPSTEHRVICWIVAVDISTERACSLPFDKPNNTAYAFGQPDCLLGHPAVHQSADPDTSGAHLLDSIAIAVQRGCGMAVRASMDGEMRRVFGAAAAQGAVCERWRSAVTSAVCGQCGVCKGALVCLWHVCLVSLNGTGA